jgi:hypothetical protein
LPLLSPLLLHSAVALLLHYAVAPLQLAEEDAFDSEKDAASVAYNAAVKGAAKVGCGWLVCSMCQTGT